MESQVHAPCPNCHAPRTPTYCARRIGKSSVQHRKCRVCGHLFRTVCRPPIVENVAAGELIAVLPTIISDKLRGMSRQSGQDTGTVVQNLLWESLARRSAPSGLDVWS
jgi:hypothetical protein